MNFDFNIGAIVKLGILGTAEPIYRIGKVIEVTPTEVVIIPQLHVYRKKSDDYSAHLDIVRQMFCPKLFILDVN